MVFDEVVQFAFINLLKFYPYVPYDNWFCSRSQLQNYPEQSTNTFFAISTRVLSNMVILTKSYRDNKI